MDFRIRQGLPKAWLGITIKISISPVQILRAPSEKIAKKVAKSPKQLLHAFSEGF